ncbi:hypothetical protein [Ferrimicrobium acidiphilum]|uniref:hypothetical protein n=2 Tax=Ferrimicrobium acidiphilum TaxID=121039 RepID=UPI0023F14AA3|nr:hypothetical protein [Ferrimicrobium acidiphilum]
MYADGQRMLDAGAAAVLVPHVPDLDEAKRVIAQMVYLPLGSHEAGCGMRVEGEVSIRLNVVVMPQ